MFPRSSVLSACLSLSVAAFSVPTVFSADAPPASIVASDVLARLRQAPARVALADGSVAPASVAKLDREWSGDRCRIRLTNVSSAPVRVAEVVAFDFPHGLPGDTPFYGESLQMLSQHGGTLAQPRELASLPDRTHYRVPEPEGMRTCHGMMMLRPVGAERVLLAFTSAKKFVGRLSFDAKRLRISYDCESLELAPGATWEFEEFIAVSSADREALYDRLTADIAAHHPRLPWPSPPAGWCSWYCFGPGVTAKNVEENSDRLRRDLPELRYVQIDDGYQPWMGDWLDTGKAFGGGVEGVLKGIRRRGLEPAIWVAPFVVSPQSRVFKDHPDWFVKDAAGKPLASNKIGFGGWRLGPWYVLDGTHPAVQRHFENVFRTMREKWGVTYFKLDANYWGMMHGGYHHDPKATRLEAYRRGMEAILRGVDGKAFVLGCNHPIWGSFGLIHGSRSSMDTSRGWGSFKQIGRENLLRGWQNGRLWWNDPDCLLLLNNPGVEVMDAGGKVMRGNGAIPENEFLFHAATVYASGGMLLSGDDLTRMTPKARDILKKTLPPTGKCARFEDENFSVGVTELPDRRIVFLFNWEDKPVERRAKLPAGEFRVRDHFTGEDLGKHSGEFVIPALPGRSSRVLDMTPVR